MLNAHKLPAARDAAPCAVVGASPVVLREPCHHSNPMPRCLVPPCMLLACCSYYCLLACLLLSDPPSTNPRSIHTHTLTHTLLIHVPPHPYVWPVSWGPRHRRCRPPWKLTVPVPPLIFVQSQLFMYVCM